MSDTFAEVIQPLLRAYDALEAEVRGKEAELAGLREQRNRIKTAVRALAPERVPASRPKKKDGLKYYSAGAIEYVRGFLQENMNGEFGSTALAAHPSYQGVGTSTLPAILRALHEEGFLRLARRGKGSSRYYEVIR